MIPDDGAEKHVTTKEAIQAGQRRWEIKPDGNTRCEVFHFSVGTDVEAKGTYENPNSRRLLQHYEPSMGPIYENLFYYDTSTNKPLANNPRKIYRFPSPPRGSIRVRQGGMGTLVRKEISPYPIFHKYQRVRTLDPGDGVLGGMNGGIYIVKGTNTNRLYVEKVFRTTSSAYIRSAKAEIQNMRRLIHNSIIRKYPNFVQLCLTIEEERHM
jgi:hypothetical protein